MDGHTGFDAFLSYTRNPDAPLATAVRDGLHRLARPWYRLRAMRVFRDESSLAASPGLGPSIERALLASRYLVVFASPQAAASSWVRKEIRFWLDHKSPETVILVVTGGELAWDESCGDFDEERSSALPPILRGVFRHAPLHVDLRWARDEARLDLRNPRFRRNIVQLAAAVHGREPDEMDGDDVRQHRRTRRVAAAAVTALSLLAVSTTVAAVIAAGRTAEALDNLRQANSRMLAGLALAERDRNLDRALLLAVHAWRSAPTPAARGSLVTTVLEAMRGVERFPRIRPADPVPFDLTTLEVSPDGRTMAASHYSEVGSAGAPADGRIYVWDVAGGDARVLRAPPDRAADVERLIFGAGGRYLAAQDINGQVLLWDLASGSARRLTAGEESPDEGLLLDVTPDHRVIAVTSAPGRVVFLDAATGRDLGERRGTLFGLGEDGRHAFGKDTSQTPVVWDLRSRDRVRLDLRGPYGFAQLSPDAGTMVLATGAGLRRLDGYDATDGRRRWSAKLPGRPVASAVSPRQTAVWTSDGTITLVRASDGAVERRVHQKPGTDPSLGYSPSGRLLVASASHDDVRRQTLLDASTGRPRWTVRGDDATFGQGEKRAVVEGSAVLVTDTVTGDVAASTDTAGWDLTLSSDGRFAALSGEDVRLIDLTAEHPKWVSLPGEPGMIYSVMFDPAGKRLVGVGQGGAAVVWDVASALRPAEVATPPVTNPLALSPDGVHLLYRDANYGVWRRDLSTGRDVPVPPLTGASGLVFSPDGTHVLASLDKEVMLWPGADDTRVRRFPWDGFSAAVFSGDGRRLALSSGDATGKTVVTVYRVGDGGAVARIRVPDFVQPATHLRSYAYPVFGLDRTGGRLAASMSPTQLRTWNVATGESSGGCDKVVTDSDLLSDMVQFAGDGKTVVLSAHDGGTVRFVDPLTCAVRHTLGAGDGMATLSRDDSIMATGDPLRLWDVRTLEPLGDPLLSLDSLVEQVVFTSDGSSVMALLYDGSVRRWPVDPELLVTRACAIAGRELSPGEADRFLPQGDARRVCLRP